MSDIHGIDYANTTRVINAKGGIVMPTWVDSHTHIVYAGSREKEFVDRINGLTYEEIAQNGGGILNSAKRLHNTSESELFEQAKVRIEEIMGMGTGAVEIKSGYGLTVQDEVKMLRVIKLLKNEYPITIKSTFLGAHAIPADYKENRAGYINLIIEDMIPLVAEEGLAEYVDVFCDRGFFTPNETDQILKAGAKHGLIPKIHANELDYSGGIQIGVENNALSVDHLEFTGDEEIDILMKSETMPTLMPSTAFFLGLEYPPARKMIEAGLPVALATDYNPGSSPSGKMAFSVSLACIQLKMTPEEAINAATINSAYAMGVQDELGSITKGKKANLIITKPINSYAYIPYSFGSDLVDRVIIGGELI
jgi:imidazolonepropionase